ncbi:MAG: outer membrane protein assembly factor BamA, partial [Gammaproteobacteria bacterium]|nr:outer membrane protein assembly factor BamA [Gammaproteobacteria bacterium]
ACALWSMPRAYALDAFVVKDIKLVGLQRIAAGTVFNYLPIKVGDIMDERRSADALRALFKTGFFEDVQLGQDADLLIVTVVERPAIASINITGNHDIETDKLKKALKDVGLSENRVFDRSLLDKIEQELQRQYFSLGKYGVQIKSKVTLKDRNRADVSIEIAEGAAARIQRLNIVGNHAFSEEKLVDPLQLSEPSFSSFFSDSDKYSKEKLRGDLESLRSYYLDRGYINFNIESTQVTISPDKKDIYVAVNLEEGDKFTVDEVKLLGEMVVPRADLEKLITLKKGDTFARSTVTAISNAISERLGDDGYAFANVNAVPDINNETKRVSMTFFVDPGKRVYVRRINITGNGKTEDEVIRRELRQMEGGWFTPKKLARSRVRLQRLGYFDDVNIETPTVPGTSDQVDINVSVTEGSTGQLQASMGYGQVVGLTLQAKVTFNNFVGTGKYVSVEATHDSSSNVYSVSYTNPYYTDAGVSRSLSVFYRSTNAGALDVGHFTSAAKGGRVGYVFPISEYDTAKVGMELKATRLSLSTTDPNSYIKWVCDYYSEPTIPEDCGRRHASFATATVDSSWSHDTRNRTFFANEGTLHQVSAEVALPGLDLQYYKLRYNYERSVPLFSGFTLQGRGSVGYGDGYGNTKELPFFENFYAGGVQSVRGFAGNSLGTQATKPGGVPLGGSLRTVANIELIFPLPFAENSKSFRLSAFSDIGNVFAGVDDFDAKQLRSSYGLTALWVTPVGVLTFSWGWPYTHKPGDEREVFQFFIGAPF